MAILGLPLSAAPAKYIEVGRLFRNQRSWSMSGGPGGAEFIAPANGFLIGMGAWIRRSTVGGPHTGQPWVWFGTWQVSSSGEPGRLLGYTDRLPVPLAGDNVVGLYVWTNIGIDGSPAIGAIRVSAGQRLGFGLKAEGETIQIGAIGFSSETYFARTISGEFTPPTDPFVASSSDSDPPPSIYATFFENIAPTAAQVSPANGAAINPQSAIFVGSMDHAFSVAPYYMRMKQIHIEVSRDSAVLWDFLTDATPEERASMTFSRAYAGGPPLVNGPTYRWRMRASDDFYTWSEWTGYNTFTINPVGQVDTFVDPVPVGKIDNDASAQSYRGKWFHPSGFSMNQAAVAVYRALDLSLFRVGYANISVASSAQPGTTFNTGAVIGALPPGQYAYKIAGRATDGQYSPFSEPPQYFSVNSPPTIPSNLQPPSGAISTSIPLLEWNIDDLDIDDVMGIDADSQIELIRPDGSVVMLTTFAWNPLTGKSSFQLTSTQLNQFGRYKWRVRGRDTSAGAFGISAYSVQQTFDYIAGPVVIIDNPTFEEAEGGVQPVIQFHVASGLISRYEVRLYAADELLPKNSSNEVTLPAPAASAEFIFPAGWVRNFRAYDVEVTVWNPSNILGKSLRQPFTLDFDPAVSPLGFEVSPIPDRRDPVGQTSIVLAAWQITQLPPNEFGGYNLYRRKANESESSWTLLRTLSVGQTRWRDYWAPPNTLLIYGLSQMQRVGVGDEIDIIESELVELPVQIFMDTPVLNSVYDPYLRIALMSLETDLGGSTERPKAIYVTWGSNNKGTEITTPAEYDTAHVDCTITLRSDARGDLLDHLADWRALVKSGHPLCARFEIPEDMMYCSVESWDWERGDVGEREISMSLIEIDFTPGSAGGS